MSAIQTDLNTTGIDESTITALGESVTSNWTNSTGEHVPLTVLASRLLSYKVGAATLAYWLPAIALIGLPGNIICFIIMLKPHNRRISCCNYMAALAITDSVILLTALDYWTTSFKNRPPNNTECRTMAWILQASSFSSMILIFAMTADRFIAIRFPFRARTLCTTYRTRVAIGCIVVSTHVYTLPYLFTSGLLPNSKTCVAMLTTDNMSVLYNWLNIFLGSIVPFVGLLSMNTAIIVTIRRRGKYFEKSGATPAPGRNGIENEGFESEQNNSTTDFTSKATSQIGNDEISPSPKTSELPKPANTGARKLAKKTPAPKEDSSSRDNQLTVMLLLVTFTFLLLTLPQYARYLASNFWNYVSTPERYAEYVLTAHVTNRLFNTNSACNFFLYCLSGTRFRQDLVSLFRRNK